MYNAISIQPEAIYMKLEYFAEIKTSFIDADFWIVRRGDSKSVGKPVKEYNKEHIGIKVIRDELYSEYLFWAMTHLHQIGEFERLATGTINLINIRVSDIKNIELNFR